MTLNIGCRQDPWGDVRIDVIRSRETNVIADAHFLPFRDKTFENVRMWHVIDHWRDPKRALCEARRVTHGFAHAKFPYRWDRIPFILSVILSLNPFEIGQAIHHCFWQVMTQLHLADSPWAHRWLVQPFGQRRLNKVNLLSFFSRGRKARYLSRFGLRANAEWECWG